ncbi:MAG: CBS domain-containing protein [Thermoanaerobaculia bacterium]
MPTTMRKINARDLMNPSLLTVDENMSVRELASFLLDNQISGAPVAADSGDLVGVVSMTDIAAAASKDAGVATDRRNPEFYLRDLAETYSEEDFRTFHIEEPDRRVGEIMTPTVYSVGPEAPVSEIATLMLDGHLHRVLVSENNRPVGIISTSDLLGLLIEEN